MIFINTTGIRHPKALLQMAERMARLCDKFARRHALRIRCAVASRDAGDAFRRCVAGYRAILAAARFAPEEKRTARTAREFLWRICRVTGADFGRIACSAIHWLDAANGDGACAVAEELAQ